MRVYFDSSAFAKRYIIDEPGTAEVLVWCDQAAERQRRPTSETYRVLKNNDEKAFGEYRAQGWYSRPGMRRNSIPYIKENLCSPN